MNVLIRSLILIFVSLVLPAGEVDCQVPEFSNARLYRCRLDEKKPITDQPSRLAPLDDHLVVDSPGAQIRPEELCIVRQMFLELPAQRRHRDTILTYDGIHLVNDPDFLVVLSDAQGRPMGAVLVEEDHQTAGYHEISGSYRTLPVQHMQIELFLQLTAMHGLDR